MNEPDIVSGVGEDIKAGMKRGKIVTADAAVRLIRSGDTVALDGLMGGGSPEELITALEKRYLESGELIIFAREDCVKWQEPVFQESRQPGR